MLASANKYKIPSVSPFVNKKTLYFYKKREREKSPSLLVFLTSYLPIIHPSELSEIHQSFLQAFQDS